MSQLCKGSVLFSVAQLDKSMLICAIGVDQFFLINVRWMLIKVMVSLIAMNVCLCYLLAIVIIQNSFGERIENPGERSVVSCGQNDNCTIICNQTTACQNSIFYIQNNSISIQCDTFQVCRNTVIVSLGVASFNFTIGYFGFEYGSFKGHEYDGPITVNCIEKAACFWSTFLFYGKETVEYLCIASMDGACDESTIYVSHSINLRCESETTCDDIMLFFPRNTTNYPPSSVTLTTNNAAVNLIIYSLYYSTLSALQLYCTGMCSSLHGIILYGPRMTADHNCATSPVDNGCFGDMSERQKEDSFIVFDSNDHTQNNSDFSSYSFDEDIVYLILSNPFAEGRSQDNQSPVIPPNLSNNNATLVLICIYSQSLDVNLSTVPNAELITIDSHYKGSFAYSRLEGPQNTFVATKCHPYQRCSRDNVFYFPDTKSVVIDIYADVDIYLFDTMRFEVNCVDPDYCGTTNNIYSDLNPQVISDIGWDLNCATKLEIHFQNASMDCSWNCGPDTGCEYLSSSPTQVTLTPTTQTDVPSSAPIVPSTPPSFRPTVFPTYKPSNVPTSTPSDPPTLNPSTDPTSTPSNSNSPTPDPSEYPTTHPTSLPTRNPSIDPTENPSKHPNIISTETPTNDPSSNPTAHPTSHDNTTMISTRSSDFIYVGSTMSDTLHPDDMNDATLTNILAATIFIVIVTILIVLWITRIKSFQCKQKHDNTDDDDTYIENGLMVMITIGNYDDSVDEADIDGYCSDLPVDKDMDNFKELCAFLNYALIPNQIKLSWTEQEIVTYLKEDVVHELLDEDQKLRYDGLIVCISAHGIENEIITSDYRTIEKDYLHRILSVNHPQIREIPRIFLFDSCQGQAQRNPDVAKKVQKRRDKIISVDEHVVEEELEEKEEVKEQEKCIKLNDLRNDVGDAWTTANKNPDYLLAKIHAANIGYQAKCNTELGSYLIYHFVQRMKLNIEKKENKTLADICDDVQRLLHDLGKSHPETVYNECRNLKFRINPSNP
eukprot:314939_1